MENQFDVSALTKRLGDSVLLNASMKNYTTFKTGGNADILLIPKNADELLFILDHLKNNEIPYEMIGNGSNVIVTDRGVEGAVIVSSQMKDIAIHDNIISSMAGNLLSEVANAAMQNSLSGMEFASGIPGSVGGAVYMNAGAYGGEIKDILKEVKVINADLQTQTLTADMLQMGYRTSIFNTQHDIILSAQFELVCGEKESIKAQMNQLNSQRRLKQPLEYPSAGSTFKRPEGYFAAKLIEDAGLKGHRIGGAMVSEKHAGFIVNFDHATSGDVLSLIEHVQTHVYEQFAVMLIPEVKIIGRK